MSKSFKIFTAFFTVISICYFAYITYPKWFPVRIDSKKKHIPEKWLSIEKGMERNEIINILGYPNGMDMWAIKADEWVLRDKLGWFTLGVVYDENSPICRKTYIIYKLGDKEVYSKPYILK